MNRKVPPTRCYLCGASDGILSARFHQIYSQKDSTHVLLDWWECIVCRGWFVYPVPLPDVINRHLANTDYNDPLEQSRIAKAKEWLQQKTLKGLSHWTEPGELLDFGCNFGHFLVMAREAGWVPNGFEPYTTAADIARAKGFDVRSDWSLEQAGFTEQSFSAITAIDVFCLVWDPIATLRTFHRLLKPGGVLAMRLTNKRFVLGLARVLSRPGSVRDTRISQILLGQFHSIGVNPFRRIVQNMGFDRIRVQPHAVVAPWASLGWQTQIAYSASAAIYHLSLTQINLSPGILLFARKALVDEKLQPVERSIGAPLNT